MIKEVLMPVDISDNSTALGETETDVIVRKIRNRPFSEDQINAIRDQLTLSPNGLSTLESQVMTARFNNSGRTNQQIAQELGLKRKAVDDAVARGVRKLFPERYGSKRRPIRKRRLDKTYTQRNSNQILERLSSTELPLSDIEKQVLIQRFSQPPKSRPAVAAPLGITQKAVRSIERRTLKLLFPEWFPQPSKTEFALEEYDPALLALDQDELIQKALAGDIDAFGKLYLLYRPHILGYAFQLTGNRQETEDLTSQTFFNAFKTFSHRQNGNSTINFNFLGYLFTATRNIYISSWRRHTRVPQKTFTQVQFERTKYSGGIYGYSEMIDFLALASQDNIEQEAERSLDIQRLPEIIALLPSNQKAVINLRFLAGLSIEETARALDKTPSNVRVTQHKALERLKTLASGYNLNSAQECQSQTR